VVIGQTPPEGSISIVVHGATLYVPMESLIDKKQEAARIEKELKKVNQEIERINGKLSNEGFLAKAPEHLVNAEKEKLGEYLKMLAKLEDELGMVR